MASSSTLITCIHSVLHDAELFMKGIDKESDEFIQLRIYLLNLKTFVLCAEKLHTDGSLRSFLVRIEDVLCTLGEEMRACCPGLSSEDVPDSVALRFREFVRSLDKMDNLYATMLNATSQSSTIMANQVLQIIDSFLENLKDYQCLENNLIWYPFYTQFVEVMKPLREWMIFLKNLVQFVEAREDLLAHTEAVAICASYLLFQCRDREVYAKMESWKAKLSKIWMLVRKIKPVDPQVYQIYTRALCNSKLSRQTDRSVDNDAYIAMRNFLESLINHLWHMLRQNASGMVSLKDQMQELDGGLLALRATLKKLPPTDFDMEIQCNIADLVCDAGIKICSFYQKQLHLDLALDQHELLEEIKTIVAKIEVRGPEKAIFNSPKSSSYGFIDFILEKLMELTSTEAGSFSEGHLQTIQEELAFSRSFLGKFVELREEREEIQTLWDRLLEVAYKVESLIDHLVVSHLPDSFSASIDSIIRDIGNLKEDMLRFEVKEVKSISYTHLPSEASPQISNEVIGFQDEESAILDRLKGGSKQLRVIAVVGMPGQGKTTFATKVYNHSSISDYFSVRAWSTISQVLDRKKVLLALLSQTDPKLSSQISSETSDHDVADKLRRSLKGRRYLIFLDDIWTTEAWNMLKDSFPNDSKGSRILLTSRSHEMPDPEPLVLRELNAEESLELLQRRLFPGDENGWPPALHDLGMQMAERCKGLPLAIIVLAGLLANMKPEGWTKVLDGFNFVSSADYCRYTLELSYKHLPDYLKPCLLYFGAFQEDQEVRVRRLVRVWIAEGFVRKPNMGSLEDVAEAYLKKLIGRSLVMVSKQRYDGGVRTCRIHDLLRDFCVEKAKDEHFFQFLKGRDELVSFNEVHQMRRLCIDSEPQHFTESKLFCPRARSLLLRCSQQSELLSRGMSLVLHFFRILKVLDLEQIMVGCVFPSEIQQLVLLEFLAIQGMDLHVPSWIANLSNLETLIIFHQEYRLSLPERLWSMHKLSYLYIRYRYHQSGGGGGLLPIENLDNSSVLYELNRFYGAEIPWNSMEKVLRKFPNIRKLKCELFRDRDDAESRDKFVFPEFCTQLESLHMSSCGLHFGLRFEFASLTNLKKLTLSDFTFYWEIFSVIGNQLPALENLTLDELRFRGEEEFVWEMKEGEFSKLRILHLRWLPLRRWIASDYHEFECFQKLVLERCRELAELPSCLECIDTLEMIEVFSCPETVENLVRKIEEEQQNYGNFGLKMNVRKY